MARPSQEAIDTFISITGADEAAAARKLEVKPAASSPTHNPITTTISCSFPFPIEIAPGPRRMWNRPPSGRARVRSLPAVRLGQMAMR
jgi:hypothetical protein